MQDNEKRLLAIGVMAGVCIAALLMVAGRLLASPSRSVETVTVPDFVGMSENSVDGNPEYEGLRLLFTQVHNGSESVGDHVIFDQSPAAGKEVPKGTEVTLQVNVDYTQMRLPDFVGGKLSAAQASLEAYGAYCTVSYQWTEDVQLAGRISQQEPAAGRTIAVPETVVKLSVWTTDAALAQVDAPLTPEGDPSQPAEEPTAEPTEEPIEEPTIQPTQEPAEEPTAQPTPVPVPEATAQPEPEATAAPESGAEELPWWKRLISGLIRWFNGEQTETEPDVVPEESAAPEPIVEENGSTLPDVTGLSYDEACAVLKEAGFAWIYYQHQQGNGEAPETVLQQEPAAGSVIDPTTHINLILAR